jgi:hypothetical protein
MREMKAENISLTDKLDNILSNNKGIVIKQNGSSPDLKNIDGALDVREDLSEM